YTAVNAAAMERVSSGGIMFTSSCSQFISREDLLKIVLRAARLSGREVRILGERCASPDHPIDPIHPWTGYLKGLLLQVL
ncbi:MAG: class I SAM-dependent rRNA methyltransferase, partial [Thermoprotei archaeon]